MSTIKIIRKKQKAKADPVAKQKLIWTVGHAVTLVCGVVFSLYCLYCMVFFYRYRSWKTLFLLAKSQSNTGNTSRLKLLLKWAPLICYRVSLMGVFASYGIGTWQNWSELSPSYYDLLSDENFQSILIALLWMFSRASLYKLLPFMITSYLHLTSKKQVVQNANDEKKNTESKSTDIQLLHFIAYSEIIVAVTILFDALMFKDGTSGFVLVLYLSIYWLRINFSPYVQMTFLRLLVKLDKKIPPKHKEKWEKVKQFFYARLQEDEEQKKTILKRS